jgi:hypothetical protein
MWSFKTFEIITFGTNGLKNQAPQKYLRLTFKQDNNKFSQYQLKTLALPEMSTLNFTCVTVLLRM